MTNENLLAVNLKNAFGDAFVGARPYGGRAYILAFLGEGTVDEFFAANKDAIVDAFRKSEAAQEISEPRPIDEAGDKICFMVYVHDGI